jgi:hypothetical protein
VRTTSRASAGGRSAGTTTSSAATTGAGVAGSQRLPEAARGPRKHGSVGGGASVAGSVAGSVASQTAGSTAALGGSLDSSVGPALINTTTAVADAVAAAAAAAAAAVSAARVTGGATRFDPATGGVHAESLIRYGCYSDLTGVLAGHSVELSAASNALALKLMRAAAVGSPVAGGTAVSSSVGASVPAFSPETGQMSGGTGTGSVAAGAAVAALTRGIAPPQGLLATPPPAPLPVNWRWLTVMTLGAVLPCALVHQLLFHACLAAVASDMTAVASPQLPGLDAGLLLSHTAQPPHASVQLLPPGAAAASAQAFVLLSLVVWLCASSAHFVYRSHRVLAHRPTRNPLWKGSLALAVALQLAHSWAVCALYGGPSPPRLLLRLPLHVWAVGLLFQAASFAWIGYLKGWDSRDYERTMSRLRAYFDTRLGMYSPR